MLSFCVGHLPLTVSLAGVSFRFTRITIGVYHSSASTEIPLLCCLIHFVIVASSIAQQGAGVTAPLSEFNDVFDPSGDPQNAFMGMVSNYPNFVAEEWSHVLTWDLFVGRWIWLDGLKRNIATTAPAVLFCNLIGPPGLLIHWITCTVTGKPIFEPSEKEDIENL